MAQVGYNSIPSILPNEQQPNDYIHVQTNPGQFGGEIAQGLEGFGKGAMAGADKWGNVQTSDMSNQFQTEANNLAENYVTKQGRDALDAHENSIKAAQDLYDKKRNELSTPDQFARFDAENRPFLQRNIVGRMNTHANEQGLKFADNTAKDGIKIAYNMAATAGSTGNEGQALVWAQKAADRAMDVLRNIGQDRDPDAVKAARTTAIAGAYKTYSEALAAAGRPSDAYDFAKKHLDDLGSEGPEVLDKLNKEAKGQKGTLGADRIITQVALDLRSGAVGGPRAVAVGDSLADGVKTTAGLSGDTKIGRPSSEVTKALYNLPQAQPGQSLVISSGLSNDGNQQDPNVVKTQIDIAKSKGYTPVVMGVGDKFSSLNPKIKQIAEANGAKFVPIGANDGVHPIDGYKSAASAAVGGATNARQSVSSDALHNAFHGQESGGGANIATSIDNAHGDMQIIPDTFKRFAKPGERIDNRADNIAVGNRILDYYSQKYNGDPARVAVAYFSGEGNVAPAGSPTPWLQNRHDGQGTFVSQYVNGILTRLKRPGISGGPHPMSPTSYAGQPTATPGWEGAAPTTGSELPSPAAPGATSDLPVQNASATDQTPATPEPPKPPTPEDIRAESYKRIMSDPAYDDPIVRAAAERRVEEIYTKSAIAAEQDRKSKEANKERALNDVNQLVNKGDHEGAYAALRKHLENKEIDDTEYARASGAILKSLGEEDPMTYGRNYLNVRHRALADASDPNKIYSNSQLYDEYEKGNINWKGVTRISEMLIGKRRDQLDFIGKEHSITAAYDQIGQGLTYANDASGLKDPAGRAYKDKAIIDFDAKLNDWIKKDGDLDKFPLFDPKHLDDFIGLYRDKKKMAADQMREIQQRMDGTFVPPAPEGVPNSKGWDTVVANPPWLANGKRASAQNWATKVELLAKDPSLEAVNEWDDYFKKTDLTAGSILQSLGIPLPAGYTPKTNPAVVSRRVSAAMARHER